MTILRHPGLRFLVVTAILFVVLQRAYIAFRDSDDNRLNHVVNAEVSATIINLISPERGVEAVDGVLRGGAIPIDIRKGCEGFEVMIIMIAVMLAFPMPLVYRITGMIAGCLFIYVLNIIRIVSLFYITLKRPEFFDAAHISVWQTIIIMLATGFFLWWISWATRTTKADPA